MSCESLSRLPRCAFAVSCTFQLMDGVLLLVGSVAGCEIASAASFSGWQLRWLRSMFASLSDFTVAPFLLNRCSNLGSSIQFISRPSSRGSVNTSSGIRRGFVAWTKIALRLSNTCFWRFLEVDGKWYEDAKRERRSWEAKRQVTIRWQGLCAYIHVVPGGRPPGT
jgi:hypothetical protein